MQAANLSSVIQGLCYHPPYVPVIRSGYLVNGATTVMTEGTPQAYLQSVGFYWGCPYNIPVYMIIGSSTVYTESSSSMRMGDPVTHAGLPGNIISGASTVFIGG